MPQLFPKSSFVEKEGRTVCEISPLHLLVSLLESFLFLGTLEFCFGHKKNPGLRVPYLCLHGTELTLFLSQLLIFVGLLDKFKF